MRCIVLAKNYYLLFFSILLSNLLANNLAAKDDIKALYLPEVTKLNNKTSSEVGNFSGPQDNGGTLPRRYLVFVSFSMPNIALKSLYLEANSNGGVLLLRGLKNGSFKETAAQIKALEIGVQIDPIAFKKYQIDKVPTIVLVDNLKFYAISGNISFNYAKQKLLEAAKCGG